MTTLFGASTHTLAGEPGIERFESALADSLFELAPVAVYVCDRVGRIVRCNRRAVELWGRMPLLGDERERYCGSYRLYTSTGEFLTHDACRMADVLRTGVPVRNHEVIIERPDGSRIVVLVWIEPLREASGEIIGAINCFQDITERKREEELLRSAREQQDLLLREMVHRAKNLFSVVSGLVALSLRSARTAPELAKVLQERLISLSRAYDLTLRDTVANGNPTERSTTLEALVRAIVSPYDDNQAATQRIVASGPAVIIGGTAITSLALLLHELATNAAKYGALSAPTGKLHIEWATGPELLELTWRESGGPKLEGQARNEGFGSVLARQTVTAQFQGQITREWWPDGLVVKLSARLDRLMR